MILGAQAGTDAAAADSLPADPVAKGRSAKDRYLAFIRVDLAALSRGEVSDGEVCEIAGVGPIPVAVGARVIG